MINLQERCRQALAGSRRLRAVVPTVAQLENVERRLKQIFTEQELQQLDDASLIRQVERVWPVAQYVDRPE